MSHQNPSFRVDVDVRNPGEFFACGGLLELAHRLWPGAEGWFDVTNRHFGVIAGDPEANLEFLVENLRLCKVSGLTDEERHEQKALEIEKRELAKLSPEQEERRKDLGERARKGALRFGPPLDLLLDWWQTGDDEATPKTWAGRQEIHKIARSAQDAFSGIVDLTGLFDHGCIMRMPKEYRKRKTDGQKSVEPFYFDARRFSHPLHVGFSLDVVEAETIAHPGVELLGLIGLQRFRPRPAPAAGCREEHASFDRERARARDLECRSRRRRRWTYDYFVWSRPLSAPVAAGVACGAVPTYCRAGYRFTLEFRDNRKRYKAFGWASTIGDDT